MANTLTIAGGSVIVAQALKALTVKAAPMVNVCSVKMEPATRGNKVITSVVPARPAAAKLSDYGYDRSHSNVSPDVSTGDVIVNCEDWAIGFNLSDADIGAAEAGAITAHTQAMIEQSVASLVNTVQGEVYKLVTASNFGSAVMGNVAALSYSNVVALRTIANGIGLNDGALVINSTQAGSLRDDSKISNALNSQKDVVTTGTLGKVVGFNVVEAISLPANSEGLVGFICDKSAIALVSRPTFNTMDIPFFPMTDDVTGLSLALRVAPDVLKGKHYYTLEMNFGVSKASTAALKRIISGSL